ncbi:SusD/RagB family nutrient-binding outer membrane lipoprotein [Pontibacter liquoris]|uniref:SusD/RagB family nutrient-binding outer membrane lipoprotein n=1 Tax=Pontibacter liquoris TaxID=2905677 RepID=UPI001FA6C6ED|nr:SusD/RagB family nutrient-binding outer membrane lipoprotein [Pontibacter liquoris]
MKKLFIFLGIALAIAACTDNFEEMNINKKQATEVPAATLLSNAQRNLVDALTTPNVNSGIFRLLAQQWTETTYTEESNYDFATRNIPQFFWHSLYRDVLRDLKESKDIIAADESFTDPALQKNQLAIVEIMEVYTWTVLVDTYGDIPYFEALDYKNVAPKYDDDAAIYADLFTRLDNALASLDTAGSGSFTPGADLYYNGDVAQWIKFGNSLKLKMGMTIADVDPAKAQAAVTAAAPNVFTSNADNATLDYQETTPNTNPVWVNLVQSGRDDFVPANTLVDRMNELKDPRRAAYFTEFGGAGQYKGGVYGASNNFANFSHVSDAIQAPGYDATILSYSDVEFYLAEAAARGFISDDAASHYNAAITASMEEWGIPEAQVKTYLAQPSVAYNPGGDFRQQIGLQKWIALYNRGFEAWTEYRRLDYPQLVAPSTAEFDVVPTRFPYPANESQLNSSNYTTAASAMGGDLATVKVFWDVN